MEDYISEQPSINKNGEKNVNTNVKKNVEAWGNCCAKIVGALDGLFRMPVRDATIPEPMVITKKECWKCHPVISKASEIFIKDLRRLRR